ncbi:MAG: AI-2E family transporter [Desulfamplus sp.]|nr:AI-2E family transporter [Desulfamplus sp.]
MSNNPEPEVKPCRIYFCVILGAILFAFIQSFALLSPILLSFLLILLITLALNPVISRVRSWTGGRRGATGLLTMAMIVFIALTGWASFGPMKTSVTNMSKQLPAYWERLQKPLIKMEQQAILSEESLRSSLSGMLLEVVGSFTAVAFNGAQILVVLVTVFFGVIFTLMNPRPIFGAMFSLMPECYHNRALTIMGRIGKFVPGWAGAMLLDMLAIGLLVVLFMWPIFGLIDALILGLIAGIMASVPFIGALFSAVPALLLALGMGGITPMWVLLAYIAVQSLEGNVIQPFIMARGIKLHPMSLIFSMLLCVAAFGILGVLLAAPLVAIADILHDELYRKRFLPTVTDADLDNMARKALHEKHSG